MALIPEEHSHHVAVIQDAIDSAPGQQAALTDQIAQIQLKQDEIVEQIEVLNGDVIDYSASRLQAILSGRCHYANSYEDRNLPGSVRQRYAGEWTSGTAYFPLTGGWTNFVSFTDTCTPYTHKHYICLQQNTADDSNKPPNSSYWQELTNLVISPSQNMHYNLTFSVPAKVYGATLRSWSIDKWIEEVELDPDPMVPPVYTMTYVLVYGYEAGVLWGTVPAIDTDVLECVAGWEGSVDLIKKPIVEPGGFNPTVSASYGLEAIYSTLEKAKAYLSNNRDKVMQMVTTLSKYIPR